MDASFNTRLKIDDTTKSRTVRTRINICCEHESMFRLKVLQMQDLRPHDDVTGVLATGRKYKRYCTAPLASGHLNHLLPS
jgi:hypothetical protein